MRSLTFLILLFVSGHALPGAAEPLSQQKVFSIADLHGDFQQFKAILERLGLAAFDGSGVRWTGGNSILVCTGDIVDRGVHSRPIYLAFQELARQAPDHGGDVVNIFGNHELMNLEGDFRYVPSEEMEPKGDYGGEQLRAREWGPNGIIGSDLRKRYVAAAVRGRTLFVHGGLEPDILRRYGSGPKSLEGLNSKVRELIRGQVSGHQLFGEQGPFWNRFFVLANERDACERVGVTLAMLGVDRMVVGHTPQRTGVNARCEGPSGPRIIMADTFISKAYEMPGGRASAIEYDGDAVTAIYFPEDEVGVQRIPLSEKADGSNEIVS